MAISDNPSQVGSLAMSLAVSPLVVAAIILRFIATRKAARKVGAEDWSAFLATVSCLGFNLLSIWCICLLDGHEFNQVPISTLTTILKASYLTTQFFPLNQFFSKISILLLYHRIFGINKRYAQWIWGIGIAQTVWTLAAMLTLFFQCRPVHYYWDRLLPDGECIDPVPLLVGFEVPNSSIDFAMVVLALVMLRDLKMRATTRWKVAGFFAAGGFAGIIGFLKIAAHFTAGQMSNTVLSLWGNAQMLLSILCCCVPIYNSLFSRCRTPAKVRSYPSPSINGQYHSSPTGTHDATKGSSTGTGASRGSMFFPNSGSEKAQDGLGLGSVSVSREYGAVPGYYQHPDEYERGYTRHHHTHRHGQHHGPSHSRNSSTDSSPPDLVPETSNLTTSTNYTAHRGATSPRLTTTTSQTPLFSVNNTHETDPRRPSPVHSTGQQRTRRDREEWAQLYEECSRDMRTPGPKAIPPTGTVTTVSAGPSPMPSPYRPREEDE